MKKNSQKKSGLARKTWLTYLTAFSVMAIALSSCKELEDEDKKGKNNFPLVSFRKGIKLKKLSMGLTIPLPSLGMMKERCMCPRPVAAWNWSSIHLSVSYRWSLAKQP
jgi:hypothetical protein